MLDSGRGVKKVLRCPLKETVEMLIFTQVMDYLCFFVFSNSNTIRKTHEK